MSNKKEKKDAVKNTSRIRKVPMLKLGNKDKILARIVYTKDNRKCFGIDEIDINKIRISERSLYSKHYNAYTYYVLYEHNNEYMPWRITLRDVVSYHDVYNDTDKSMNFKINNDEHSDKSYQKLENMFEHIEEKLSIALNDFTFEKVGGSYFKTKVNDETCFKEKIKPTLILKEGKVTPKESYVNFTPKENVMYTCRVLFQIQSVFFKIKDKNEGISYYLQLFLQQCIRKHFINKVIYHPDLEFTDTKLEP